MLFSWLFSNTGRLLQTYNFTLEFQFYYCCCLFIIVFLCICLLPLVASLRTKSQSSGYYPDTQSSEVTAKFWDRTRVKCQIFLAKCHVFFLNLYTDLRQIKHTRTDFELSKFLSTLIYTSQNSLSICTPIICPTWFQYFYYILTYWYSLYIFLNKSLQFQNTGPDLLRKSCPTAVDVKQCVLCSEDSDQGTMGIQSISFFFWSMHMQRNSCLWENGTWQTMTTWYSLITRATLTIKKESRSYLLATEKMPPPSLQLLFIFHYETK